MYIYICNYIYIYIFHFYLTFLYIQSEKNGETSALLAKKLSCSADHGRHDQSEHLRGQVYNSMMFKTFSGSVVSGDHRSLQVDGDLQTSFKITKKRTLRPVLSRVIWLPRPTLSSRGAVDPSAVPSLSAEQSIR